MEHPAEIWADEMEAVLRDALPLRREDDGTMLLLASAIRRARVAVVDWLRTELGWTLPRAEALVQRYAEATVDWSLYDGRDLGALLTRLREVDVGAPRTPEVRQLSK